MPTVPFSIKNNPYTLTWKGLHTLKFKTVCTQHSKASRIYDCDFRYTHTHTQIQLQWRGLPLSATFHSGLSWPGLPGLRPTEACALGKHHHLGHMEHAIPVTHTGWLINGVWALDMTGLVSLCDKEFQKATVVPFSIACVHTLSVDYGLLSSQQGKVVWNSTLA